MMLFMRSKVKRKCKKLGLTYSRSIPKKVCLELLQSDTLEDLFIKDKSTLMFCIGGVYVENNREELKHILYTDVTFLKEPWMAGAVREFISSSEMMA